MSARPAVKVDKIVQAWMLVEVEIEYQVERERLKLVIVPDEVADFNAGFLGEGTPLARAIMGEKAGTQVPYFVGDARTVQILSVEETDIRPGKDIAIRRQEILKQAVEESERTSAMIFASSFSGKWGDYDPQGIESWETSTPKGSTNVTNDRSKD